MNLPTMNLRTLVLAAMVSSVVALAQTPTSSGDGRFQIGYAANVTTGDSYINISNDGASMTTTTIASGQNVLAISGSLCANIYAFAPDEEMLSCCSCPITPNGLVSVSVQNDLLSNTFSGRANPSSVVIKLIGSTPPTAGAGGTTGSPCGTSASGMFSISAPGLVAWITSLHSNTSATTGPYSMTENPFIVGDYNPPEIARLANLCTIFQVQGSGYGICASCQLAGQGAAASNQ